MLTSKVANAVSLVSMLAPADAADTTAATSAWIAVTNYEGFLVFSQHVGEITEGAVDGIIQHATDSEGAGAATAGTFSTQVTTDNDAPNIQKVFVECNAIGPYVRYVGTIDTGPAVVGVTMVGTLKSVP